MVAICRAEFACVLWVVKRVERKAGAEREDLAVGVLLCSVRNRNRLVLRSSEAVSFRVVERHCRKGWRQPSKRPRR